MIKLKDVFRFLFLAVGITISVELGVIAHYMSQASGPNLDYVQDYRFRKIEPVPSYEMSTGERTLEFCAKMWGSSPVTEVVQNGKHLQVIPYNRNFIDDLITRKRVEYLEVRMNWGLGTDHIMAAYNSIKMFEPSRFVIASANDYFCRLAIAWRWRQHQERMRKEEIDFLADNKG